MNNYPSRCKTISTETIRSLGIAFGSKKEEELFHSFVIGELEERVGASISQMLSREQLDEFDKIDDMEKAEEWLETNVPTYKAKVAKEIEEMKLMLMRLSKRISTSEPDYPAIRSQPIDCLDLSVRTFGCLSRYGIKSIGELIDIPPGEFKLIRNLSVKCLNEIEDRLKEKFDYQLIR